LLIFGYGCYKGGEITLTASLSKNMI